MLPTLLQLALENIPTKCEQINEQVLMREMGLQNTARLNNYNGTIRLDMRKLDNEELCLCIAYLLSIQWCQVSDYGTEEKHIRVNRGNIFISVIYSLYLTLKHPHIDKHEPSKTAHLSPKVNLSPNQGTLNLSPNRRMLNILAPTEERHPKNTESKRQPNNAESKHQLKNTEPKNAES